MDKELADAIQKLTVVVTKLTKTTESLLKLIEDRMPLNLEVGTAAAQSDSGSPAKRLPEVKPLPDRHDRANLAFAQRYGDQDEVRHLLAKFDWS